MNNYLLKPKIMKKRIISIMLTIAIFGAYTATAAPIALSDENPAAEKVDNDTKDRKDRKNFRRGDRNRVCMKTPGVAGQRNGFPFKALNLTDEQKTKVSGLIQKQKEEKEEFAKKCKESFDKDLKKILTPEQLEKYEEICKNRQANFQKMKYQKNRTPLKGDLKELKTQGK